MPMKIIKPRKSMPMKINDFTITYFTPGWPGIIYRISINDRHFPSWLCGRMLNSVKSSAIVLPAVPCKYMYVQFEELSNGFFPKTYWIYPKYTVITVADLHVFYMLWYAVEGFFSYFCLNDIIIIITYMFLFYEMPLGNKIGLNMFPALRFSNY